ncbi:MAG TPA: hypothetical protein VKT76_01215 [Bradyrhizobium sp.]|nr:hypothetical protein [Bradyrhizobium sp.]
MPSTAKRKATDDPHDAVVVPSDQVRVASSDAEITDLLRAAARHRSKSDGNIPNRSGMVPVPTVDTTFRATAVNDDLPARRRSSFGRRAMRAVAALLLAAGIGGAAMGWQVFGYAAKKALVKWMPQMALTNSLSLDKLGLSSPSQPAEPAVTEETQATPAVQAATESVSTHAADVSSDSTQLLQSMARDLANVSQEVEALKASIAELKASQQQTIRDKAAEQNAKAKALAPVPHPAAARKPAPVYSPTPTPAASSPAYRPVPSYSPAQAQVGPPLPPIAQPYPPRQAEPPSVPLQPQAEPGFTSAPRPPLPVQ